MGFYLRYALRALRRSGQRTLLVIVSVAFGVMALVTMQILSDMIADALLGDPRVMRGGDVMIDYASDAYLSEADLAQLEDLKTSGRIDDYTVTARTFNMLVKPVDGSKTAFVLYAIGVDPDAYPLVGEVNMRDPAGADLAAAICETGHIAITRDMAADLNVDVGDRMLVTDGLGGAPQQLVIGGVIEMLPDHFAKSVLYSLETAQVLANNSQVITGAILTVSHDPEGVAQDLRDDGWQVNLATDFSTSQKKIRNVFNFGLKGAGMLALLVGGIGVANTMQVVLARRTTEIAVLKTMGYRQRHLLVMFGIETLLIGIAGSAIGILAALLLARPMMHSMENTGIFLMSWLVDAGSLISGGLAGVATTVIFGFYAILQASSVRPAVLLRQFSTSRAWQRWLAEIGVYIVLVLPFSVVSMVVMGSVLQGLGVIALALAGFLVLGLVMGGALWITTRLPMPRIHMATLARNNLKRQRMRLVFALIALFVGVVAIGFSVAAISAAQREVDDQLASLDGPNFVLFGRLEQEAAIQAEIDDLNGVKAIHVRYPAELTTLDVLIEGEWQPLQIDWLEGRQIDQPAWGLELSGEPWGRLADGVYLPQEWQDRVQPGARLRIQGASGDAQEVVLAGFYRAVSNEYMSFMQASVVASREIVTALSTAQTTVIFDGELAVSQLDSAVSDLSAAIPGVMVISSEDVRAVVQGILFSLLTFVITVAGLALVAGAVLIANAVGLAMIERRREIGVMKAVGYTRRHVMTTLVMEYAQLGLLAGVVGTVMVVVVCRVLQEMDSDIVLTLDVLPALAIILVCMGLAVASVMSVAWHPTQVPPLVVLRDE